MTDSYFDTHVHFGQFEDVYYSPHTVIETLAAHNVKGAYLSSTTSCMAWNDENEKKIIITHIKDEFEEAFIDEFNYTFQEFQEVILFLLENAEKGDQYLDGIIEIDINECINHLKDKVKEEVILKILDRLSLQEREDYLKPPEPYIAEDVYPWRFNRELSLSRKPLIIYSGEVIYGYRILSNSIKFLFDLIGSAKFRAKSSKMKAYISKIEKDKGRRFNDIVYNVISENKDIIVDKNVKKINKKKIMSSDNNELGDIDVLCISPEKGIINLIETKDLL